MFTRARATNSGSSISGSFHLGSVRSVVKASSVLDKYDYKPFGALDWSSSGTTKREGYIGKEMDRESNLGDFGVRKYDAEIGRFMSVDPLWEAQPGHSPYHYAYNDPINGSDGSGMFTQTRIGGGSMITELDAVGEGARRQTGGYGGTEVGSYFQEAVIGISQESANFTIKWMFGMTNVANGTNGGSLSGYVSGNKRTVTGLSDPLGPGNTWIEFAYAGPGMYGADYGESFITGGRTGSGYPAGGGGSQGIFQTSAGTLPWPVVRPFVISPQMIFLLPLIIPGDTPIDRPNTGVRRISGPPPQIPILDII